MFLTHAQFVALDVFSSLVPLAALVIRSPRSKLANDSHHNLLRGIQLLELAADATPCKWYRLLLQRGQRLAARATLQLASRWTSNIPAPSEAAGQDVDAMLGNVTRLHERQTSDANLMGPFVSLAPQPVAVAPGAGFALLDDSDFERWLSSLSADPQRASQGDAASLTGQSIGLAHNATSLGKSSGSWGCVGGALTSP